MDKDKLNIVLTDARVPEHLRDLVRHCLAGTALRCTHSVARAAAVPGQRSKTTQPAHLSAQNSQSWFGLKPTHPTLLSPDTWAFRHPPTLWSPPDKNWERSPSPLSGAGVGRMPRLHLALLSKQTHVLRSVSQGRNISPLVPGAPQCPRKVLPSQATR